MHRERIPNIPWKIVLASNGRESYLKVCSTNEHELLKRGFTCRNGCFCHWLLWCVFIFTHEGWRWFRFPNPHPFLQSAQTSLQLQVVGVLAHPVGQNIKWSNYRTFKSNRYILSPCTCKSHIWTCFKSLIICLWKCRIELHTNIIRWDQRQRPCKPKKSVHSLTSGSGSSA